MVTNYNIRPAKRYIQDLVMNYTWGMRSNALILGGPESSFLNYIQYIASNISRTKKAKVTSYEIREDIYLKQVKQLKTLGYNKSYKFNLVHDNIGNAKAERYIDLDLMGNINTCSSVITNMFQRQKVMQTQLKKVFNFTVCLRSSTLEETIAFLEGMLKTDIKQFGSINHKYGKEYLLQPATEKYLLRVFTYRDGCVMLNCLIIY